MTDGKTKTINGLKSKSGKKFDCALKLSPEFKVVLDLPDQGPSETFSTPCPKCKGENTLHVNDVKLWCSTCDFVVWKEKSKYVLTNDELQALCQNGKTAEISDFVSKKGTTYKAFVVLDKDCKAVMELSKRELAPLPYACPKCHSQGTVNIDGGFIASVAEGCGWKVWKEPFQHALTDEELEQLFTNGKTEVIKGLKGKKNTFDSALTWSEDFSITFVRSESSSTPVAKACPKCGKLLDSITLDYRLKWLCNKCTEDQSDVLHCERGCKVKAVDLDAGLSCDSKQAHELLTEGQVYEVEKIHVGGWCSSIRLKEFPGKEFNTVHFIRYE